MHDVTAPCESCGRDRGAIIRINKTIAMDTRRGITVPGLIDAAREQGAIVSVLCRDCEAPDDE